MKILSVVKARIQISNGMKEPIAQDLSSTANEITQLKSHQQRDYPINILIVHYESLFLRRFFTFDDQKNIVS